MSKQKDSDDLVLVGPGTAMGELMRQYWIPAVMSSELERDGAPMRLMLLGERLIAFRDSSGRVGVMDHRCPHRCASLFLGRNERTASAASITAGNTTRRAIASTCRTRRRIRTSSTR
jgi:phthalate 4,5-dioxygenase oxygenase subunit